jgi:hypothetical protein
MRKSVMMGATIIAAAILSVSPISVKWSMAQGISISPAPGIHIGIGHHHHMGYSDHHRHYGGRDSYYGGGGHRYYGYAGGGHWGRHSAAPGREGRDRRGTMTVQPQQSGK